MINVCVPIVILFVIAFLSYGIGLFVMNFIWKIECIKRGLARYNETTNKWEWN